MNIQIDLRFRKIKDMTLLENLGTDYSKFTDVCRVQYFLAFSSCISPGFVAIHGAKTN